MSSANSDTFTSFPIWIPFFFLVWLPWLGLPKLYWIKVLRVDILGLLLILKEILSVFHYCKWCLMGVCYIWPLLLICWGKFTLSPLSEEFYHKWILNFIKNFAVSIGWSYGFYYSICYYGISFLMFLRGLPCSQQTPQQQRCSASQSPLLCVWTPSDSTSQWSLGGDGGLSALPWCQLLLVLWVWHQDKSHHHQGLFSARGVSCLCRLMSTMCCEVLLAAP